jgi:kinesin family member 14
MGDFCTIVGNDRLLCNVHEGATYAEETASTLRYAAQAKKIVNIVTVNENPYVKMIKKV